MHPLNPDIVYLSQVGTLLVRDTAGDWKVSFEVASIKQGKPETPAGIRLERGRFTGSICSGERIRS
jgi:hypothetical protein